jgi:hypothetical protein
MSSLIGKTGIVIRNIPRADGSLISVCSAQSVSQQPAALRARLLQVSLGSSPVITYAYPWNIQRENSPLSFACEKTRSQAVDCCVRLNCCLTDMC